MSSYILMGAFIVILLTVSIFGGHFGYTVNGVPHAGAVSTQNPGIFGALGWVWDSVQFLFEMMTFQIDGMPAWWSGVSIFMVLMIAYLFIKLIRGTD
jgi:hypothetical protein